MVRGENKGGHRGSLACLLHGPEETATSGRRIFRYAEGVTRILSDISFPRLRVPPFTRTHPLQRSCISTPGYIPSAAIRAQRLRSPSTHATRTFLPASALQRGTRAQPALRSFLQQPHGLVLFSALANIEQTSWRRETLIR